MSKLGNKSVRRGDVYWINLDPTVGSEVKTPRPGVIISNNAQNMVGVRYIVAPATSVIKKIYPFEAQIKINDKKSKAMLDQIRTIDHRRLGDLICHLQNEEMIAIDNSLKLTLSLS